MNERINELAIQCGGIWRGGYVDAPNGDSVYTDKKFVDGSELNVTQFAELIVQECVKILVTGEGNDNTSDAIWDLESLGVDIDQILKNILEYQNNGHTTLFLGRI